jgi:hypothetical protein
VNEKRESLVASVDLSGPSVEADCLDVLVAFPAAIDRMRASADPSAIPQAMTAHTLDAFARADRAKIDLRLIAVGAQDTLYRNIVELSVMDQYTVAYVRDAIRHFFEQLSARDMPTYFVLDNELRVDRFQAVIHLFELAAIQVVTPARDGDDWGTLEAKIRRYVQSKAHVAYVEPSAVFNYISKACDLSRHLGCVASFRNEAPSSPQLSVLSLS